MHRTIEITVPPSYTDEMINELEQLEQVISLLLVRGGSVKPPGDLLTVHVLNRGADEVISLADTARQHGQVSVSTGELTSLVDPEHERKVANDIDEALWEEVETELRQQSRTTANYLGLMFLGGVVVATGFVQEGTSQAISFIAASIISPGFEPLAKIPMGLALRRWGVIGKGLKAAGSGYLALVLSAGLTFLVLRLTGVVTVEEFITNPELEPLVDPTPSDVLLSVCGAVAGMIMLTSYRQYLVPGALIALTIIEAAGLVGVALVAGQPILALEGLGRFGLDALFVIAGGVLVVLLKQAIVHRRLPMI